MRVLLVYPNFRGMNMLPPSIALFSAILKQRGHAVSLFDATDYPNPEGEGFDSDKVKEKNLNVRPFDDSLLKKSFKDEDVFDAFERCVREFGPDLLAVSITEANAAYASAPHWERKPPVTLRWITAGRKARSHALLWAGTCGSAKNTNKCWRCLRYRLSKGWAAGLRTWRPSNRSNCCSNSRARR